MTTANTSTGLERSLRPKRPARAACLRLCWSVAPAALGRPGRPGRAPLTLELELREGEPARVTLDGQAYQAASEWAAAWDGTLTIGRVGAGSGKGLMIAEALPLAVVVLHVEDAGRPLHVTCKLPEILGLRGGRYELVGGGLSS